MKKLALVLAFLMILPGAAFGLEMLNDGALDNVSGQAGVSIFADDVQIFLNIERIAWIDCDGFSSGSASPFGAGCSGDGAALGIQNFQVDVLQINAIVNTHSTEGTAGEFNLGSVTCGELELNWDYGNTNSFAGCAIATAGTVGASAGALATTTYGTFGLQTLGLDNYDTAAATSNDGAGADNFAYQGIQIDVTSQLPAGSEGYGNLTGLPVNVGGVMISIPTMEFYIPSLTMTPALYNLDGQAQAVNDVDGHSFVEGLEDGANFGTIEIQGLTFTTLGGWLEIGPH